jgi:hypothetical protein
MHGQDLAHAHTKALKCKRYGRVSSHLSRQPEGPNVPKRTRPPRSVWPSVPRNRRARVLDVPAKLEDTSLTEDTKTGKSQAKCLARAPRARAECPAPAPSAQAPAPSARDGWPGARAQFPGRRPGQGARGPGRVPGPPRRACPGRVPRPGRLPGTPGTRLAEAPGTTCAAETDSTGHTALG